MQKMQSRKLVRDYTSQCSSNGLDCRLQIQFFFIHHACILQRPPTASNKGAGAHREKGVIYNIMPSMNYINACEVFGVTPMVDHHSLLCNKLFSTVVSDVNYKLNSLLPPPNKSSFNLRNNRPYYIMPHVHTNRARNSFILAMARLANAMS